MNYLAHVFLSGDNEEILYGNILEDFMHGTIDHPRNNHLTPGIKKGIRLHRRIDTLTDSHPLVSDCKAIFYEPYHHYASIVVDVIFDHFLMLNWKTFSDVEFEEFKIDTYRILASKKEQMPPKMLSMVESMLNFDWLGCYIHTEGLESAFKGLNKRIKKDVDLIKSINIMFENYDFLNQKFLAFFDLLQKDCNDFLNLDL